MLALIAGTGALPAVLVARLNKRPLVCAMAGFKPDDLAPDLTFRIENLGMLLEDLRARGVTQVCMAGAVRRPKIEPSAIDPATQTLLPVIMQAMSDGDDGALRAVIGVFEQAGFAVVGAHEIAPDLLMNAGVPTQVQPDVTAAELALGDTTIEAMGHADQGQACVVRGDDILAKEGPDGTDAMLQSGRFAGGVLFKAPKPTQDRRADLPLIGRETVRRAAEAGLRGIVIAAGGVMVLDGTVDVLDRHGLFLKVRG